MQYAQRMARIRCDVPGCTRRYTRICDLARHRVECSVEVISALQRYRLTVDTRLLAQAQEQAAWEEMQYAQRMARIASEVARKAKKTRAPRCSNWARGPGGPGPGGRGPGAGGSMGSGRRRGRGL